MNDADFYLDALKRGGHRITEQRRAICAFLADTPRHPTPLDVYIHVSEGHPEISRATVYNTLNALRDLGAIVEISAGGEHTHYDTNPAPHMNLICLRCDEVFDHEGSLDTSNLYQQIYSETGFQPVVVQVQIMGFCPACRAKKRDEIRQQLRK